MMVARIISALVAVGIIIPTLIWGGVPGVAVPQRGGYDTEDRIERGAQLLQELITAGL